MIEITLNGELKEFPQEQPLAMLCATVNIPDRGVAVAVNNVLIPRSQYDRTMIRNQDVVEIITAAAGG